MYYQAELEPYEFKYIYSDIQGFNKPIIVRFDINSPVNKSGRISTGNGHVNLRLEENAYLLRAYSKLGPLILMGHQGRKPKLGKQDKDYISLLDHHNILSQLSGIRIHFLEHTYNQTWEEYAEKIENYLKTVKKGEAILMDNVRYWDFEQEYNYSKCPYIPFFKDLEPAAYINDALPVWHRDDSSLMFGRHVAPTYIGHISMRELRVQHKILFNSDRKAIIIGGKKPKFEAIPNLVKIMDVYTAGVTGILTAHLSGHEIGPKNEGFLKSVFKGMEKELAEYRRIVEDYKIRYPADFILSQPHNLSKNNRISVKLKDLNKPEYEDYQIYDIGPLTVKEYSNLINSGGYDWRIRAGPNGVYEEGFSNGINLIENILGTGFVALGGDTIEELQHYEICKTIMYSDGAVLLGGGSHLEGFAGAPYPCIKELVEEGCQFSMKSVSSELEAFPEQRKNN